MKILNNIKITLERKSSQLRHCRSGNPRQRSVDVSFRSGLALILVDDGASVMSVVRGDRMRAKVLCSSPSVSSAHTWKAYRFCGSAPAPDLSGTCFPVAAESSQILLFNPPAAADVEVVEVRNAVLDAVVFRRYSVELNSHVWRRSVLWYIYENWKTWPLVGFGMGKLWSIFLISIILVFHTIANVGQQQHQD